MKVKKQAQGFTLIELLLTVALLAIAVGVTSDILVTLIRSYNKTQVTNEIEQQANFFVLKLEKDIRNARRIDVAPTAPFTTDATSITMNRLDTTNTPMMYSVAGGVISRTYLNTGGCPTTPNTAGTCPLTNTTGAGAITVSCPTGSCFTVTGTSPQVLTVAMRFQQNNGAGVNFNGQIDINTTIVLRNTYNN